MILTTLTIFALSQIIPSEIQEKKPRVIFQQAVEGLGPVPLCDEAGKCVCPEGFTIAQQQSEASNVAWQVLCVEKGSEGAEKPVSGGRKKRANDTDYEGAPQPYNFGK